MATLGDHLAACQHLSRAAAVDANNSAVYLRWGKSLEALEKPDEALEVYRQGMDVASRRGDLMPLREMEHRVLLLEATQRDPREPDAPVDSGPGVDKEGRIPDTLV